jgi:hypothetical protein
LYLSAPSTSEKGTTVSNFEFLMAE